MFIKSILVFIILLARSVWSGSAIPSHENNCVIQHNGQKLHEGDVIDVNGKMHKVEDCGLHRAYHVCGTHIMFIVNIVCQAVEKHKVVSHNKRYTRFVRQKLLTEACCQSLCTVSEMTRYCPR